jgi:hypothetical protein
VIHTSLAAPVVKPDVEPPLLDEERIRDQLSAAEELHYVGHAEPALIAAGAALAGVLRLRGGSLAGRSASGGALSELEHELLNRLLRAHQRLTQGYAPDIDTLTPLETERALTLMVHLLEDLNARPIGI